MKKNILLLIFIFSCTFCVAQSDWTFVTSTKNYVYCINSKIRTEGELCYVWEQRILCNDSCGVEKRKLSETYNKDFSKFSYVNDLYLYDMKRFRTTLLESISYDENGNVLDDYKTTNINWSYIAPGTIAEALFNQVKLMVSKKRHTK